MPDKTDNDGETPISFASKRGPIDVDTFKTLKNCIMLPAVGV